jgi:hypothetical protein
LICALVTLAVGVVIVGPAAPRAEAVSSTLLSTACPSATFIGKNGAMATTFAQGFPSGPFGTNACDGVFDIAFDNGGNVYVADQFDGSLYRFPAAGGSAAVAAHLGHALGPGAYDIAFGIGGELYGVEPFPNGNISAGAVVQLNPQSGAVERVVTNRLTLPTWMAVDPATGDLFVTNGGTGGNFSPDLWRIRDPDSTDRAHPPTVSVYGTDQAGFNQVAVAPNGSVYATTRDNRLVTFGATDTPQPAHETTIAKLPSDADAGLALGPAGGGGAPSSVFVASRNVDRIDLPSGRVSTIVVSESGGVGDMRIGPDGCLYMANSQSVVRVSNADGLCAGQSSDVASYVPTPAQVPWTLRSVAQSWFWVALLIVLLGAASTLFNATLDANLEEIQGWFAPLRSKLSRKAAAPDESDQSDEPADLEESAGSGKPAGWRGWRGLALYLFLAGIVYTVRSPSLGTFADFAVGIGVGSLVGMEVSRRRIAKRSGKIGQPVARPSTLLIATAFMIISVLASAKPGYVFGIVIGMAFVPALEEAETGAYAAFGAALALVIGLAAWLLRWPLAYPLGAHPSVFHRFVADVLAVIFVSSVCTVAFGMAPLRFLPGEKVRAWNTWAWAVLWAIGLFGLVHILESGYGYASAAQERTPTLVLGVVMLVVAVAFWAYFRRRGASTLADPQPVPEYVAAGATGSGGTDGQAGDAIDPSEV